MAKKTPPPESTGRMIGYARVSTTEQKLDLQLDALRRAGVGDENIHTDTISAVSKRRRGLDMAFRDLRQGDVLVVWRLDRLARSLRDLINRIQQLEEIGAGFRSLTETIDTTTAGGRLILHVLGAIAEFERQLIAERTAAGMRASKERGNQMGRPKKMTAKKMAKAVTLLKQGYNSREVADAIGVHPQTIYDYFPGGKRAVQK